MESSWQAADGPAVILGAGGAARAVVVALIAEGVAEIRIVNRTYERARALADAFGATCQPLDWSDVSESLRQSALLVNKSLGCGTAGLVLRRHAAGRGRQ